jgi:hypothetical protein
MIKAVKAWAVNAYAHLGRIWSKSTLTVHLNQTVARARRMNKIDTLLSVGKPYPLHFFNQVSSGTRDDRSCKKPVAVWWRRHQGRSPTSAFIWWRRHRGAPPSSLLLAVPLGRLPYTARVDTDGWRRTAMAGAPPGVRSGAS